MEDSKIIDLLYERSETAITLLSAKYGALCERIAYNILNNKLDAEEVLNDTYLGVWNTVPPQRPNPLISYVCKITRNIATKKYHSNTAKKRNSVYDISLSELENCFPSSKSVEDEFDAKAIAQAIDKFLLSLDKESRVMFVRRYYCADTLSDISKLFNKSNHYVSVRLSRIREKLKNHLIKEGVTI